jgi:hypothetical protein
MNKSTRQPLLHPRVHGFHDELRALLPEAIAGFLGGLCAASASIWGEGGLAVEVSSGPHIDWQPSNPSSRGELLEFFACVCGNRSPERPHEAAPALAGFEASLGFSYPACSLHLQIESDEPGCWCVLHVLAAQATGDRTYIRLFWSID